MAEDDDIKPEVVDVEQMKRENYFNLGRDDYMSLDEYLLSPQSDRDLKSKRGKATLPKYDRPNKDDRMSDRDKEVLKKVREKNPRVSDQDLALVLGYIGVLNTADEKFKLIGPDSAIAALVGLERIFARQRALAKFIMAGDTGKGPYQQSHFNFLGDSPQIDLSQDTIAKSMFLEIAESRGIDLNKFGKFDSDGNFIDLDAEKATAYFDPRRGAGTYGYGTDGKSLTGFDAAVALQQDIRNIHRQVHDIMLDIVDYGTMDKAEFRATSRTRGTPGTLTEVDVNDETGEFYSLLRGIGGQDLVDKWKASGRKKAYTVKFKT